MLNNVTYKNIEKKIPKLQIKKMLKNSKTKGIIDRNIQSIILKYQIVDNIPSYTNNEIRVESILFIEVNLREKTPIGKLANELQKIFKTYVVLRFNYDEECFDCYAIKEISKIYKDEIIVKEILITENIKNNLDYSKYIDVQKVVNKNNKYSFYKELYIKALIINNAIIYNKVDKLMNNNLWYNSEKLELIESFYNELKKLYVRRSKAKENYQIGEINTNIKNLTINFESRI